jgi:hypothetical protein
MTAISKQRHKTATKIRFHQQSVTYIDYTGQLQYCLLAACLRLRIEMCWDPWRRPDWDKCQLSEDFTTHISRMKTAMFRKLHSERQHRSLHWKWRVWLMVPQTSGTFNTLMSFLIVINDGNTVTWFGSSVASSARTVLRRWNTQTMQ